MRTRLFRVVAVAIGLSGTLGQAQSDFGPYQAPARWNNFNAPPSSRVSFAADDATQDALLDDDPIYELPVPTPEPDELPMSVPHPQAVVGSEYAPCEPAYGTDVCSSIARPRMARYFGGGSLLFLTLENGGCENLIVDDATGVSQLNTSAVDPNTTTGFEVYGGKYLACNRYGLSIGYLLWNPSPQGVLVPAGGGYRAAFPAWNGISIDPGTGVQTVYDHYDGAAAFRANRDMIFQGIEANLSCFGIMGAQRAAACCSPKCRGGWLRGLGLSNHCDQCKGYGRAGGPIIRSCDARVQVVSSHGFRWFQVEDEFQLAANINGAAGYQADDLYYDVETENNLFGYQFGSRLVYCLNACWNLSIGGKFGLYGNHAEYRQRLGTETVLAYRNGAPTDFVNTRDSDTVLSTLGELDLGIGYRFGCAWTIRGGYRLFGITGIATATDQFASDYNSIAASGSICANDSLVLHGGYIGAEYNW